MEGSRVLFFVPFGAFRVHNQLDLITALAVRARGSEVVAVGCDKIFRECDVTTWAMDRQAECNACFESGRGLFTSFNIP